MNWVRFIAKRYLKAKRNTRFLNLSTALSMGGIGLGVTAIIVVLSVMRGFEGQLREKLVASDLHVLVTPESSFPGFDQGFVPKSALNNFPALPAMATSKDVSLLSYNLSAEVVVRSGTKVSGVQIKGVDENRFAKIKQNLTEEALPQMLIDRDGPDAVHFQGVFIGKELSYEMGLIPGDFITVISPSQMDGPFSNIPRIKRFVVQGIYHFGVPEQESSIIYTTIENMESFLRKKGFVSEIEVTLKDSSKSEEFVEKFRKDLPGLRLRDWNELNSSIFASMKLERMAMFLILLFTVVIASLNIVSTLSLLVQEKLKEIAILKTLGARKKDISGIFLWKGVLVGGSGVVFGTGIALLICIILKKTNFIALPDVYYDRNIPVVFDLTYFIGVPVISFAIVCLASYFPASKAAKLTPLEGLRH